MTQHTTVTDPLAHDEERVQDRHIRMAVLTALQSSHHRPLWNLRCEVREGVVFLLGIVPSFFLKQVSQEVLLRLEEIKEVRNLVVVVCQAHAGQALIGSAHTDIEKT